MKNLTVPELLARICFQHTLRWVDLAEIMGITSSSLQGILKGKMEMSILAANRLINHLGLALDEFTAMLSKEELDRKEIATSGILKKESKSREMYTYRLDMVLSGFNRIVDEISTDGYRFCSDSMERRLKRNYTVLIYQISNALTETGTVVSKKAELIRQGIARRVKELSDLIRDMQFNDDIRNLKLLAIY